MTDIAQPRTDTDRALESISMEALETLCAELSGLDQAPTKDTKALGERLAEALCAETGRQRVMPIPDNSPAGQADHDRQTAAIADCLRAIFNARRRAELDRLRVLVSRLAA